MVITVNASCGISAAGGFNSATVASSINKHSFPFTTGPNNRCLTNSRATAFSQIPDQANSLQSSFDTNQHFIHHSNSTSHYNQSYLTTSASTNNLNSNKITNTPSVNFFLKDELSALTNMYQQQPHHHLAQNSSQLSIPTAINLSSVDSNQTQIAHSTHFNHTHHSFTNQHLNHHLDHLNSINSSFNNSSHSNSSHQNSLSQNTQSSHQQTNSQQIDQAHQSIQQTLDHFNSADCLHNSSLNAPELSYDFSRLTSTSKDNHENRYNITSVNSLIKKSFKLNQTNEDLNEEKKKKDSIKNKANKKMNDSSNQFNSNRTSNQIFDILNQNSAHNHSTNSSLVSSNETNKNLNSQINHQNIEKDNLSKNQHLNSLNRSNNRSPSNLLLAPNCSNEKDRFFLTETSNILNSNFSLNLLQNNDQLVLSNGQCTPAEYSSPESASSITSNDFNANNQHENRKNRNTVISSHFKNLHNSEEENQSNTNLNNLNNLNSLMNNCEKNIEISKLNNSQNSYTQSTNDLKLLIKPEPDDVRDQTSVSSSENSIYSLETLSNSTEFNGYHSPAHSLLFGHALNGMFFFLFKMFFS